MITSFLNKIKNQRAIVIGDVMIDEYLWGSVDRISPEAPVPIVALDHKENRLGGAANVALNLISLGIEVQIASVIGNDNAGKILSKLFKQSKIGADSLIKNDTRTTTCKTRVIARNQQILRIDEETLLPLNKGLEDELIASTLRLINKYKPHFIIFEDYNKGVLTHKVIQSIIKASKEKNIITSVDPKKTNFFSYNNVTLFKPNLRELKEALNSDILPKINDINNANEELRKNLNHTYTLITLSEHGMYYSDKKNSGILAAHKRDISDVSGAGDTVISVASAALSIGLDIHSCAALSNLAGGLVCEHAGVVPITQQMLMEHQSSIII